MRGGGWKQVVGCGQVVGLVKELYTKGVGMNKLLAARKKGKRLNL